MKSIIKTSVSFSAFVLAYISLNAQVYTVNPADFEYSMNIIGKVSISQSIIDQQNSLLGAFVGDDCVGVASPIEDDGEYKLFYLTIYSNQSSGEQIEFKFSDENETESLIANTVEFVADKYFGSSEVPFLWMDVAMYSSADFLNYSFAEQFSPATINTVTKTIEIVVAYGTNLATLIPTFEIAPGAKAFIAEIEQQSAITPVNFTNSVIYNVQGVDGSSANWTVSVSLDNSDVENFEIKTCSIYPNPTSDILNISIGNWKSNNIKFELIDILGQTVYRGNIVLTSGIASEQIDISNLNAGMYLLKLSDEKQSFVRKVEKK